MSSVQYSSVNNISPVSEQRSTGAVTGNDANTSLTEPPGDGDLTPIPVDPYMTQQSWLYLQFFIPLLVVFIFPTVFAISVYANGHVSAPKWLSDYTKRNPRTTSQIVTIFASVLTATTRWALGGAAALLVRKRLLAPRPIFEIDMFFSLRNISVIWDWKHRRRMMVLTWLLVVTCGLLTSGFVSLFNPLSMKITTRLPPAHELDIFTNSNVCIKWYDSELTGWLEYRPHMKAGKLGGYYIVSTATPSLDFGSFTRAMIRKYPHHVELAMHYFSSKYPLKEYPTSSLVSSYRDLNYTRISGNTAGALVIGPAGVSETLDFPDWPQSTRASHLSYSLDLQGFWIDTSCSYDKTTALNITWGKVLNGTIEYRATCPGSSTAEEGAIEYRESDGVVGPGTLWLDCTLEGGARAILFRYFITLTSPGDKPKMDYMKCNISPQIGDVKAVLDPDPQALTLSKGSTTMKVQPPATNNLTTVILSRILPQFEWGGPMVQDLENIIDFHTGDAHGESSAILPDLVALALQGLFEIEASIGRRFLTMAAARIRTRIPPECLRQVEVALIERVIGWEVKWATLLGLLPLLVVCVIALTMIALAFMARGKLTLFDPMSPVSLIAATSVGEVVFPKQAAVATIGDPLDEAVLSTKVSYGQDGQTWGLRSFSE